MKLAYICRSRCLPSYRNFRVTRKMQSRNFATNVFATVGLLGYVTHVIFEWRNSNYQKACLDKLEEIQDILKAQASHGGETAKLMSGKLDTLKEQVSQGGEKQQD